MAAFVPNGSARRSRGGLGGFSVSSGREARDISFMPAGVEGGWGAVVRAVLRFGVEGGGKAASESVVLRFREFLGSEGGAAASSAVVVVVVVVLRFLEFFGSDAAAAGASFLGKRLLAALSRLERRVAIAASEGWEMVMRRTRCITLEREVRRWVHVIA